MFSSMLMALAVCVSLPDTPRFEVHSTSEKLLVGSIDSMRLDGTIELRDQKLVAGPDVISLRKLSEPLPQKPIAGHVVLFNGDCVTGSAVAIADAKLEFNAPLIRSISKQMEEGNLHFPLTSIAYLWLRSPDSLDKERYKAVFAKERTLDLVVLRNGDVAAGTLTELSSRKSELLMEVGMESRAIGLGQVIGIALSTKTARARTPPLPFSHLVLEDGSRLSLANITVENRLLYGVTVYRERLQIPLDKLASLDVYGGKALYLSDLKPLDYVYRSYLNENFLYGSDRNIEGDDLHLKTAIGMQTYDKGLSLHGECTLAYAAENCRRFEAVVGLDPKLGARGAVQLALSIDGREVALNNGKPLTLENGPLYVKQPLDKAKRLTLMVKSSSGHTVGAYVNWCDARLIR